ncbi:MAG TPA: hypothetical protein VIJ31_18515 [Acidothermaceae bacterium]
MSVPLAPAAAGAEELAAAAGVEAVAGADVLAAAAGAEAVGVVLLPVDFELLHPATAITADSVAAVR